MDISSASLGLSRFSALGSARSTEDIEEILEQLKEQVAAVAPDATSYSLLNRILNLSSDLLQQSDDTAVVDAASSLSSTVVQLMSRLRTQDSKTANEMIKGIDDSNSATDSTQPYSQTNFVSSALRSIRQKLSPELQTLFDKVFKGKMTSMSVADNSDPQTIEAMIQKLIEDGQGIDDVGELILIMSLLSKLGLRASPEILTKINDALSDFVDQEMSSKMDVGQRLAFLTLVSNIVKGTPADISSQSLNIQIEEYAGLEADSQEEKDPYAIAYRKPGEKSADSTEAATRVKATDNVEDVNVEKEDEEKRKKIAGVSTLKMDVAAPVDLKVLESSSYAESLRVQSTQQVGDAHQQRRTRTDLNAESGSVSAVSNEETEKIDTYNAITDKLTQLLQRDRDQYVEAVLTFISPVFINKLDQLQAMVKLPEGIMGEEAALGSGDLEEIESI